MEIAIIGFGLLVVAAVARWLHKRAEIPKQQTHSAAKRDLTYDPKEVAGSGMAGYGADR